MYQRVVLCIALLFAVPVLAQSTHLVSKIDVRGGVPEQIVLTQTTLTAGRSYSDDDLEIAMARLRRLDFVFDARYTIEGETLVIEVDAMRRVFAEVGANGYGAERDQSGIASVGGGGRLLLRSGGVAEARVSQIVGEGDDVSLIEAAYSQYGIGGTRLFATAAVSQSLRNERRFDPDPTWRLMLGYPLTLRQTITGSFTDEGFETSNFYPLSSAVFTHSVERRTVDLRWTFDTSDDPYFARRGLTIAAGPTWSRDTAAFDDFVIGIPGDFVPVSFRNETTVRSINANARKYFATGTRGALLAGAAADWTDFETSTSQIGLPGSIGFDARSYGAAVTAGYVHNLFDRGARSDLRQRVELTATYGRQWAKQELERRAFDRTSVDLAYVLRHRFATVRFNLSYAFGREPFLVPQAPAGPFLR